VHGGISIIKDLAKSKKLFIIFVISASLVFSLVTISPAFASTTFSIEDKRLDTDGVNSISPKFVVDGSNVYVIWQEGADIFFDRSTDGGTTFVGPVNLSSSASVTSLKNHHISVSGANIYAVWKDGNDIFVSSSNDSGATFGAPINISNSGGVDSRDPQITSLGNNAYVVWRDITPIDIRFSRTTDSGAIFSPSASLNPVGATNLLTPNIAADGANVYAVWRDVNDISFTRSTDSGATFLGAPVDIGDKGFINDPTPLIVASGTDVYVVWHKSLGVSFVKSSDSGVTFDPEISLDSAGVPKGTHKIAVSGSNIYVVWQGDSKDIAFRQSTDGGATFDPQIDLSQTSGVKSLLPDIAAGSVFVVWQEETVGDANDKDIHFVSSDTDGSNFGGIQFVTSNGILATDPQVAASGNDVYVVWSESTTGASGDGEIKFSKGSVTTLTIDFPGPYKMTDTATITVTDSASNLDPAVQEVISVNMTSGVDPAGILVTATENGINSNDFIAMITFSTGASSGTTLQATPVPPENTLTATFGGVSSGTTIFPRSIAFDSDPYDIGDIAFITVTDQNSNLDANTIESIVVDLSTQESGDEQSPYLRQE